MNITNRCCGSCPAGQAGNQGLLRLGGEAWYEIDDIQDLDIMTSIFTPDREEHLRLMESHYGGYWRYPIRDFCYLVNLF